MRKLIAIALASTALAACSHTDGPGIEVRTVEVPTPVPCVDEADLPAETPAATLTGDARVDSALLKAETLDLRAENGDLRALIVPGCIQVAQ